MKNLIQYIKENEESITEYYKMMDDINFEIICESFQCKILSELVAQSKLARDEFRDNQASNKYNSSCPPSSMKELFGSTNYIWDKVTDDRVKRFVGDDKEGIQLFKRICSNRSNSISGIIIFENPAIVSDFETHKYSGVLIKDTFGNIRYYGIASSYNNESNIKPGKCLEYLDKDLAYYIIELDDSDFKTNIRNERTDARRGMVDLPDKEFRQMYKRMADENMKRYKKLAAKMKMEKYAANDNLPDKVMAAVKSVMELATEYGKAPTMYAKYEYDINKLLDMVSDKSYSSIGYDKKWNTHGINGLMYLFSKYITAKLKLGSGNSYDYERQDYERTRTEIEQMLGKINDYYIKLKQKIHDEESKQIA